MKRVCLLGLFLVTTILTACGGGGDPTCVSADDPDGECRSYCCGANLFCSPSYSLYFDRRDGTTCGETTCNDSAGEQCCTCTSGEDPHVTPAD